jgi:hypothetical protein
VFLKWIDGARQIDRALYAPTMLGADILVHPTGLAGLVVPSMAISPDGPHAEATRHIVNFGFNTIFDLLIQRAEEAAREGDLESTLLGDSSFEGQSTTAFQWLLPPDRGYPYVRIVVHLSRARLLPVAITMWDADEQLFSRYVYKDLQTNVQLTAADFSREACNLKQ